MTLTSGFCLKISGKKGRAGLPTELLYPDSLNILRRRNMIGCVDMLVKDLRMQECGHLGIMRML
jgi:hypothetical protein